MYHVCMSHVIFVKCVMSRAWMHHVTWMDTSCHTYIRVRHMHERVIHPHMCATHVNEIFHMSARVTCTYEMFITHMHDTYAKVVCTHKTYIKVTCTHVTHICKSNWHTWDVSHLCTTHMHDTSARHTCKSSLHTQDVYKSNLHTCDTHMQK